MVVQTHVSRLKSLKVQECVTALVYQYSRQRRISPLTASSLLSQSAQSQHPFSLIFAIVTRIQSRFQCVSGVSVEIPDLVWNLD